MNFTRLHDTSPLARIGGAAQGGSAKPREEREKLDREHQQLEQDESPPGAEREPLPAKDESGRTEEQRDV